MEPFNYIGIFSVCLGDGFASIAGKLIPSFKLVNGKTISGSLVVFFATFFHIIIFSLFDNSFNSWNFSSISRAF